MATYVQIGSTVTVSTPTASIAFSSIPATYTDLVVKMSARSSAGGSAWDDVYVAINGSSSNFTSRVLYGTGSAAGSGSFSTSIAQVAEGNSGTASTFGNTEIYFSDYTSTTIAKTYSADSVSENNATSSLAQLGVGRWNPGTQAAITSLTFTWFSTGNFVQYSTATLYGISKS
jgi:hypothetical protein